MFSKSHHIVAAATVGVLGIAQFSNAALTIDLRFPNSANSPSAHLYNIPSPGNLAPITIEAWAAATGASGVGAEEGLQSVVLALRSAIQTAGITGTLSVSLGTGWNGTGANLGSSSNMSADGVMDWGNTANTPLSIVGSTFLRVRTTKAVNNAVDWGDENSPSGSAHTALPDGGEEFKIATFVFTPTSAALGATVDYVPLSPAGGSVTTGWFEDTNDKTSGLPSGSKSNTTGTLTSKIPNASNIGSVQIAVIPEPSTMALAGLAALGMLRRRRD